MTDFLKTLAARNIRLSELARDMAVNKSTASRWISRRVPAERVIEIERITGISRHDIRPDLYPRDGAAA